MKTAVVIRGEAMGSGSEELGQRLMGSFLRQLSTCDTNPDVVIFYNSGVRLLARGSPVLDALRALDDRGVELIACGTCVAYFGIGDQIVVGRVSDMREIASTLMSCPKVVTL